MNSTIGIKLGDNFMIEWKDSTSYSQSDKERKPTSFTVKIKNIDITIHKYVGCGDMLFVSSRTLKIQTCNLDTTNYEEAKEKALACIKGYMKTVIEEYQEAINIIEEN
jgi:hypothetical protein